MWALVTRRAAETPDAVLPRDAGGRAVTGSAFEAAAEGVAARRHDAGVRAGSVVRRSGTTIEAAVLMAALARLDAVQCPIVPILRRKEVSFILRQTGAGWFVVPGVVRGFDHAALAREMEAGDLGRIDADGYVTITGRVKEIIIRNAIPRNDLGKAQKQELKARCGA